uniref:Putative secreted protein n=1 Tax=Anopheles darlingi TaxID=43151 RepID=A0A2M4DNN5_ANODA
MCAVWCALYWLISGLLPDIRRLDPRGFFFFCGNELNIVTVRCGVFCSGQPRSTLGPRETRVPQHTFT